MKYIKLFEKFKERSIQNAIKNLTLEEKKKPIIVVNRTTFMDSSIIYYYKNKLYEAKFHGIREIIQPRGILGKPTQEKIDEIVEKIKENNKGKILFNLKVGHYYGNWVIEADKIIKPKRIDIEDAQIMLNAYDQTWGAAALAEFEKTKKLNDTKI